MKLTNLSSVLFILKSCLYYNVKLVDNRRCQTFVNKKKKNTKSRSSIITQPVNNKSVRSNLLFCEKKNLLTPLLLNSLRVWGRRECIVCVKDKKGAKMSNVTTKISRIFSKILFLSYRRRRRVERINSYDTGIQSSIPTRFFCSWLHAGRFRHEQNHFRKRGKNYYGFRVWN